MSVVPLGASLRHQALKTVAKHGMFLAIRRAEAQGQKWRQKGVFGRLARTAKRHYTFARRRLDWI
jgi:hypothetical protein